METTLEEARRCPKCGNPGVANGQRPGDRGKGTMHVFRCMSTPCRWYNTTYVIQVRPDGSIPEATMEHDKKFPKIPDNTDRWTQYYDGLLEQQLSPGGETRR